MPKEYTGPMLEDLQLEMFRSVALTQGLLWKNARAIMKINKGDGLAAIELVKTHREFYFKIRDYFESEANGEEKIVLEMDKLAGED